jgi:arginyl-tRNA synthetase
MFEHPITDALRHAVQTVLPDADLHTVEVRPCPDPRFGDYQSSALIALAKARRLNPRQLAQNVLTHLDISPWCAPAEIAGAGFVNFRLKPEVVGNALAAAVRGEHLFCTPPAQPRTVVVDFSSPNVAKPMHVGHIRSTILGDCLARANRFLGHRVITDNHLGDWGTQFGKLIVGWKRHLDPAALAADPIAEMLRLYKTVHAATETDPAILDAARQELVCLQKGDAENLALWREMLALSQEQFDTVYARLGVRFDHTLGESFYNPQLRTVVDELTRLGIARESDGAMMVFFEDNPALKSHPLMVRKSDGASNYATTDLATLSYRLATWQPDEIVYVTDSRQQLHFQQVFATFRRWHPECTARLEHVWFGSILGEDGTPLKSRSGDDVIRLVDLLDEAEERAMRAVLAKNPDQPESERREIARIVGLGALKFADLLPNRQSDYIFSWDKMLALNGQTAPYLQYAYTRIRSIFRKRDEANSAAAAAPSPAADATETTDLRPVAPEEIRLARHLLAFGGVVESVAHDCRPNYLCNYLYELAGYFTTFYEACPVLKAQADERARRLAYCDLAGRVLRQGLDLLGIETPERM